MKAACGYIADALLFAGLGAFAAEPVISADRADCLYAAGERVVFTVRGEASLGSVDIWVDDGGSTVVARAVCDFAATNVCELSAKRDTPGALRLRVAGPKCKKCLYGVLCDWERIRPAALCPSDFDAYWRGERERLAATVSLDPKMERVPARDTPERLFYRISFATFGGKRVHGAMTVPKAGKGPFPVRFHCPGAGPGKVEPLPCESGAVVSEPLTPKNAISVVMNINDFPVQDTREAQKERYAVWSSALCEKYGVGNYMHAGFSKGRDEVVFHDPVLGILRALDWLADQPFADAEHFTYYGSSQGAALGYYLTALWGRFERTMLNVPAMGDLLAGRIGRAAGGLDPVGGNPASVRAAVEASVPYYDTANFAPRIKTPTLVVIGLSDDVCPFISAVSSYNLLGADKRRVVFIPGMGHQYAAPRTPEFSAWLDGRENAGELQMVDNKASVIGGIALYKPESWNLEARQKFAEQRFGIFIHWGLYANYAQGEWYLHDGGIEESAYARMIDGFCPSKFDAREWVRVFKGAGAKALRLLLLAAVALAATCVFVFLLGTPVVKSLWSPSFVLAAAVYSLAMLALFYWIVDVLGFRRWTLYFKVIGMNSILAYVLMMIGAVRPFKSYLFRGVGNAVPIAIAPTVNALAMLISFWLVLYFFYRKKVFLKV